MSQFGEDLIKSMKEALAHSRGEGVPDMRVTRFCNPREVRARVGLTQTEMAHLMGMSLSGYRKWGQGKGITSLSHIRNDVYILFSLGDGA